MISWKLGAQENLRRRSDEEQFSPRDCSDVLFYFLDRIMSANIFTTFDFRRVLVLPLRVAMILWFGILLVKSIFGDAERRAR
jgi:hypothetical protein